MSERPTAFGGSSPDGGESVVLEVRTRGQLLAALYQLLEPDEGFVLEMVAALWRGHVVALSTSSTVFVPGRAEVVGLRGRPVLARYLREG